MRASVNVWMYVFSSSSCPSVCVMYSTQRIDGDYEWWRGNQNESHTIRDDVSGTKQRVRGMAVARIKAKERQACWSRYKRK